MNKKLIFLSILALGLLFLAGNMLIQGKTQEDSIKGIEYTAEVETENAEDHESSGDYNWNDSSVVYIELNGSSAECDSGNVDIDNGVITIESAGTYSLSGTLNDGQVIVDTKDEETVRIILNGVDIQSSSSAPIYVKDAEKVILVLADNTENYLADGSSYVQDNTEDEPNAAIFSKSDLTIYSEEGGSLIVEGNYKDGISSKDGLVIRNVSIDLTAADDGIRGKDYLVIEDSNITVDSGDNGLMSDNADDTSMGYITISNSVINVDAGGDAITGETDVIITETDLNLSAGGGSTNSFNEDVSKKGIKATTNIIINSGDINIDSADDAIHSNDTIVINGGSINISSGDDGIHADFSIEINGGDIEIAKSYEGIESAIITINDGNINIVSSDDGINVAGGSDSSAMGRPGQGGFNSASGNYYLYINGGYIYVNATGDGIDVNGAVEMNDGTVIVDGPVNSANGALDYDRSFTINGGLLIAVGSSGMAQAPDTSSTQYSVLINLGTTQQAGTLIDVQDSSGNSIFTFSPAKQYQSIAFSSPELEQGETYTVYYGTQSITLTVSGIVTNSGTTGGGMTNNRGGMMRR